MLNLGTVRLELDHGFIRHPVVNMVLKIDFGLEPERSENVPQPRRKTTTT